MTPSASTTLLPGIVLLGHGSRDPLWHQPMQAVAACIQRLAPHTPVVCACLELSPPYLPEACAALLAQGVRTIGIVPVFLGVGRHVRADLPQRVAELRQMYPGVVFNLQPAVGEDERLVRVLADIALGV